MKIRSAKKVSATKKVSITITVTEAQREFLRRVCTHFGDPGTPLASMAATAFTRGLHTIAGEIGVAPLSASEISNLPGDGRPE